MTASRERTRPALWTTEPKESDALDLAEQSAGGGPAHAGARPNAGPASDTGATPDAVGTRGWPVPGTSEQHAGGSTGTAAPPRLAGPGPGEAWPGEATGTAQEDRPAAWDDGLIARRAPEYADSAHRPFSASPEAPAPPDAPPGTHAGPVTPSPYGPYDTSLAYDAYDTSAAHGARAAHGTPDRHAETTTRGWGAPEPYEARARGVREAFAGTGPEAGAATEVPETPAPGTATRHERAAHQDGAPLLREPVARFTAPRHPQDGAFGAPSGRVAAAPAAWAPEAGDPRPRLEALGRLVGLSRGHVAPGLLAEAVEVLGSADERYRLSARHTVVALAGATGSGKSALFNALAGAGRSRVGIRRPTTYEPVVCAWGEDGRDVEGLLRRLHLPARRRVAPALGASALDGLVLLDLPDHDSVAAGQREQLDRMLGVVDAVIWVVDPEKYADAALHERYLGPLAGYAEVTFVVLNQVDRLPSEAAARVLDDLRRLLDEDGLALGEHGEPGAAVFGVSAVAGEGVEELREALAQFVAERGAAARRLAADVDAVADRLRSAYAAEGRVGLTDEARARFEERLAESVGAEAVGQAAECDWLRHAEQAYGSPWRRLRRRGARPRPLGASYAPAGPEPGADGPAARAAGGTAPAGRATSRPVVEQAVRTIAAQATRGLPAPWALAVREAAVRGGAELPDALDKVARRSDRELEAGPPLRPRWWSVAAAAQAVFLLAQVAGVLWLVGVVAGCAGAAGWAAASALVAVGAVADPCLVGVCRMAARAPARRYGQEAEQRLKVAAASHGRLEVLEPVVAELRRYHQVRELYAQVSGL